MEDFPFAPCSFDIKRGQDARTTNLNVWDVSMRLPLEKNFLVY